MKQKIICGKTNCRHCNSYGDCQLKIVALNEDGRCILFQNYKPTPIGHNLEEDNYYG